MSAAAPWSVKGIDPKAREVAKDLARRSGMTLGEWLNSMIMDDEEEGYATLPRRGPVADTYDRRHRARRLDDAYEVEDSQQRISASIDVIAARLEAAERRSTVAIQGVDQAVAGLMRRLDGQEAEAQGAAPAAATPAMVALGPRKAPGFAPFAGQVAGFRAEARALSEREVGARAARRPGARRWPG